MATIIEKAAVFATRLAQRIAAGRVFTDTPEQPVEEVDEETAEAP
ncbi:hypothetical protein OAK87_00620 [bacterium]|nr:hypothetical protein [bacterium]